jgi:lysylphosphatidylglycerol synthetase-like protein (DUF2156 family)
MKPARGTLSRRLVRWIWISAVVTGGSIVLVYVLAGRMAAAAITLVIVLAVGIGSHAWVRRSDSVQRGNRRL